LVSAVTCRAADTANVSEINHLIGRRINIGNALEAPVEGAWGGFSFTYWDFCAEYFGLYDPGTKSWRRQLLEAVISPQLTK